jgi:hypothetical protein
VAELRELAAGRGDLLAEVAGSPPRQQPPILRSVQGDLASGPGIGQVTVDTATKLIRFT